MSTCPHCPATRTWLAPIALLLMVGSICLFPAKVEAQQVEQSVESLVEEILKSLQAEGKTKIAIVELTDLSGAVTPLGQLVAEELTSQLFNKGGGRLKLIERSKLDEVLGEQRLGVKGLLEKRNVETFGKVLGVEAILAGTIAVLDDRIRINTRLIGVPSAELFATASAYMSRLNLDESQLKPEVSQERGNNEITKSSPAVVQEFQGIRYELLSCVQQTRLITCNLVLTNNGADRNYTLHTNDGTMTFIYDQRGFQFFVTRVRLADVETPQYGARKLLITEIPVEAKLIFEGVPSAIEFIKILHLSTSDGHVEFRDVRFSQ
jgi:TolB-like protein